MKFCALVHKDFSHPTSWVAGTRCRVTLPTGSRSNLTVRKQAMHARTASQTMLATMQLRMKGSTPVAEDILMLIAADCSQKAEAGCPKDLHSGYPVVAARPGPGRLAE